MEALGFERYATVFRPIAGRRLLALTRTDLLQLADTSLDADLLSDAIQDLCLRVVSPWPCGTILDVSQEHSMHVMMT